jgi:acyl-CoA reductase-like NAD-dependent aldehyde dehydrogenase
MTRLTAPTSVPRIGSFVGGRWQAAGREVPDIDPAHPDRVVAIALHADVETTRRAVQAARGAYPGWRATPSPERGEILRKAADLLDARAAEVAHDLTCEEGKPIHEAAGEVARGVAILRYFAGQCLEPDGETYPSANPRTFLFARRESVGVVAIVTPWNFPIAIPVWKIAPALAYGNTVVWKPADLVPHTAMHLMRCLHAAGLPDGVVNLVIGSGSTIGTPLLADSDIDAISFTGSSAVGRPIQVLAATRDKRLQLELGGKNAAVVLADADLDLAAAHIARAAFYSAGQKCTATSRVIVDRTVFDDFRDRLAGIVEGWRIGDPLDPTTVIGPLASQAQLDTVRDYLEIAAADGATAVPATGSSGDLANGYYVRPTIFTGLPAESRVVREEVFGPIAALLEANGFDDAVRQANDTRYALTASLFTRDLTRALEFVRSARVGVVKINQESTGLEHHVPFGGMRGSSAGPSEQGKAAREFYSQWKVVYANALPPGA